MNICIKSLKSKVREEVKKQVASLSASDIEKQSNSIIDKLLNLQKYKESNRVSVYLSMKDEVQTDKIVEDILSSGKTCFIPLYTKTSMSMVKLNSMEDLKSLPKTKWNIRQPLETDAREEASEKGIDLMITPGLAFSKDGIRLGRGKGYYDRYLTEYAKKTGHNLFTVGLAFQQQIRPDIPIEETDQKLNLVITPDCS
ncbi:5-formyltetrahydrofolate cyclo-ligase [Nilaparvata lugens]|uniref:5-formyltetrahydrofolate cyclo-ligase n=1 Tax=Nilaparvata lugens TaxID=108931 RepID=UPI00193D0587|nr:5-formyltetrahydrofolate cyclo-ligase [Nilaparvata lugens]XP_022186374.2 5-formyltetrahydrofolate cyclo-ligase [Nilaparvata lugens]